MADNDNTTETTNAAAETAAQNKAAAQANPKDDVDSEEGQPEVTTAQSKLDKLKEELLVLIDDGEKTGEEIFDWLKSKF